MFEKENKAPVKQGILYELTLGKDNGPYLTKDIMHSNPKSISLLAGSQIVKSFASLNQSLNLCETKQKQYNTSFSFIESYSATIDKIQQEINVHIKNDSKLKTEEMKLRFQMEALNEVIIQNCTQLVEQYVPLLKGLHKLIKQQAAMQKQETFRMEKEIREISEAKKQLLAGVFKCEQKILEIEVSFGEQNKNKKCSKKLIQFNN